MSALGQIALLFSGLSLIAFGGGNGIIPAMQRASVDVHHWMTGSQFLDLFALSRATPGPNSLIAVLVGERAAGPVGGLVAALAMYGPSSLLVYGLTRIWERYEKAPWRRLVERSLAPLAIGLLYATGYTLLHGTEHDWLGYVVTAAATAVLVFTSVSPMIVLFACGLVYLAHGLL